MLRQGIAEHITKESEKLDMAAHFRSYSAVIPIIWKMENGKKQVLLAKRANTNYMDGFWDFAGSGHVEKNETATEALIREIREEVGIEVQPCDTAFAHLTHTVDGEWTYCDIYFAVERYSGRPRIAEPDKCAELRWFAADQLPADMIVRRKDALRRHLNGEYYSEWIEDQAGVVLS